MEILKHLTYNNFKQIVEGYTKDKRGVQELAALFMLSKFAINIVGAGRALASQVKDLTLQYFEDKLAAYIVERGGWVSFYFDCLENGIVLNIKKNCSTWLGLTQEIIMLCLKVYVISFSFIQLSIYYPTLSLSLCYIQACGYKKNKTDKKI